MSAAGHRGGFAMRRKGEISPGAIRREYPFRLLFPEEHGCDLLEGGRFYPSCAPRTSVELVGGLRHIAVHFADEADALKFQRHAGGELRRKGE